MSSALIRELRAGPRRVIRGGGLTRGGAFTELEFAGLPEPVCRYLAGAIAVGVPLDGAIHLDVRGHLRHRRWVPFRAGYELTRALDFTGLGAAGEVVVGVERCVGGVAQQQARLAGIVPLRDTVGEQVSRSSAGRAALAALMLPTALLPRFGVRWTTRGSDEISAALSVHNVPVELHLRIDGDGRPLAAVLDRWGDPDGTGAWGWHPFGAVFTGEARFAGLTVPATGRVGWFPGTDRWRDGELLRFRVTSLRRTAG